MNDGVVTQARPCWFELVFVVLFPNLPHDNDGTDGVYLVRRTSVWPSVTQDNKRP